MKITIENNPFISKLYQTHWKNSFGEQKEHYCSNAISHVSFLKEKYLPLYTNIGKTNSSGISYEITQPSDSRDANKVFLIYDVPQYFDIPNNNSDYKIYRIKQYTGYGVDITKYGSVSSFIDNKFNKKRRKSLKQEARRLEQNYDINISYYHGKIEQKVFNEIFDILFVFLDSRFKSMGAKNNHGSQKKMEWLRKLFFDLVNSKRALIVVVKDSNQPIAISMNYLSKNVFFSAFPSFDLEYSKYGIGNYVVLKGLEWAIDNQYVFFDMGKGSFGYKDKWSTHSYPYEYHIIYKKKSFPSFSIAMYLKIYFRCKQYFRIYRDKYLRTVLGILKK
ncbi:GNAT family N-acetyltransferase [Flagellimonas sp. S3867]|uniref:GNAT family N-acetyltransferase n=1 Tax=Flagellimonas sp. S3867 TaxID=2768063 RepID=UPI0016831661